MARMMTRMSAAAAVAAAVAGASAEVYDYQWQFTDGAGGTGTYNRTTMHITGGNNGTPGNTEFKTAAAVDCMIYLGYKYSSPDSSDWDHSYYRINNSTFVIATNATQGSGAVQFNLKKGDTFGFGVHTKDGQGGAGLLELEFGDTGTYVGRNLTHFTMEKFDVAGGTAFVDGPHHIHVTGGDDQTAGFTDMRTRRVESPAWFYPAGTYSSADSGDWDGGYWVTGKTQTTVFITNATQGPWDLTGKPIFKQENDYFGIGVYTNDGQFGPGVLDTSYLFSWVMTHQLYDVDWKQTDNAGGKFEFFTNWVQIFGGNNGAGGETELWNAEAGQDYLVKCLAWYTSPDNGQWDYAFYEINGKKTIIADNDSQGLYDIEFNVARGDRYGFGVATVDGQFGGGVLLIDNYRGFPDQPPAAGCYADFDGNGTLNLFDFLAYTNAFNSNDANADCDGSGVLNLFDFLCFTNKFNAGC